MNDLNHIQLPAFVIAELYRTAIVETGEKTIAPAIQKTGDPEQATTPPAMDTAPGDQWKYLGQHQKDILIVVNYDDAVYLPDDTLGFLTNMLTACKLSLADVAIINRYTTPAVDYKSATGKLKSRTIFLFGIDPVSFGLPLSFPQFQVQSFTGTTFLFAPPLEHCKEDSLLKSKLWVCLRRIFGI